MDEPEQYSLSRRKMLAVSGGLAGLVTLAGTAPALAETDAGADAKPGGRPHGGRKDWLPGDHHIHSEFSVGYDQTTNPPTPKIGGDGRYPHAVNAGKAQGYGLKWMVATDHGGPNHAKIDSEQGYPSLLESRRRVPGVLQFYAMELDTPAADHSSLIIPKVANERELLFTLESKYSKREAFPVDPARDTEPKMLEALREMRAMQDRPLVFAHHPSRSATGLGRYGLDTPQEFRAWNDVAPEVAVGFEGAPGHQAGGLNPDGTSKPDGPRGEYGNFPTMGGFDQMTARVGGLWDSLLGEGRRWWITATSDSHVHYTEGGADFWPGEYSKTYVHAANDYAAILDGLRNGRIFVTTGDLIDRLDLTVSRVGHGRGGPNVAGAGDSVLLRGRDDRRVAIEVAVRVPRTPNAKGERPAPTRIDLIGGEITGRVAAPSTDTNPTTKVLARFDESSWRRTGDWITVRHEIEVPGNMYVRVRGTCTTELEPEVDALGADPWSDLWFYSNPVFVRR